MLADNVFILALDNTPTPISSGTYVHAGPLPINVRGSWDPPQLNGIACQRVVFMNEFTFRINW